MSLQARAHTDTENFLLVFFSHLKRGDIFTHFLNCKISETCFGLPLRLDKSSGTPKFPLKPRLMTCRMN